MTGQPVTDPAVIEAIEAELMLAVYDAVRLAIRQRMGLAAVPAASPEAIALRASSGRPSPATPRWSPPARSEDRS